MEIEVQRQNEEIQKKNEVIDAQIMEFQTSQKQIASLLEVCAKNEKTMVQLHEKFEDNQLRLEGDKATRESMEEHVQKAKDLAEENEQLVAKLRDSESMRKFESEEAVENLSAFQIE